MKTVVAALCCVLVAACAAGGARKAMAPEAKTGAAAPAGDAQSPMPGSTHDQIQQLDDEITASRTTLKLDEPTDAQIQGAPAEPLGAMPSTQNPKCRPAQTDTCKTSCTLSDSICSNADKICKLSQSMPGDNWAMNKCAKANTTCDASRTKCCGCQ